jgi:hypothetical protein
MALLNFFIVFLYAPITLILLSPWLQVVFVFAFLIVFLFSFPILTFILVDVLLIVHADDR